MSRPAPVAPLLPVLVKAGPLTAAFERVALRWIGLGEHEVLRGIYVAVRDAEWRTIPAHVSNREIETAADRFSVTFTAEHRTADVDFVWSGEVTGDAAGTIIFTMDGEARGTTRRNRIGLCVLHPMEGCAGRPCTVEHENGTMTQAAFPARVAPHQPFLNVRALTHEVLPGVLAEVRLEGEIFETEDQRNWSDTSYKTYGTPLELPFPVTLAPGTRVRQRATLRVVGALEPASTGRATPAALKRTIIAPMREPETPPVSLTVSNTPHDLPRLGVSLPNAGRAMPAITSALAALHLAHLRVDLDLGGDDWRERLAEAGELAEAIGARLEIAAILSQDNADGALGAFAEHALPQVGRVARLLLFDRRTGTTPEALVASARRTFPGAWAGVPLGGGSNVHFAELNRHPPTGPPGQSHRMGLDLIAYPSTPSAHDVDEATFVENLASVASVQESARDLVPGVPIAVTPIVLARGAADARQALPFCAAWSLGHLAALAESDVASATYFDAWGPGGLMADRSCAVYHVFHQIAGLPGARTLPLRTSVPASLAALLLVAEGRVRLLVANLRQVSTLVELPPELAKAERVRLLALTDTGALHEDAAWSVPGTGDADPRANEIVIEPHGIVRADIHGWV